MGNKDITKKDNTTNNNPDNTSINPDNHLPDIKKLIELDKELDIYPPKLRDVALAIFNSDTPMNITEACNQLGYRRRSIYSMRARLKKDKGIDFYDLLDSHFKDILRENKVKVGNSLVNEAVSGSHNHQKLYFQLSGDLKEDANITVNNLTIGINITGSKPEDLQRDKGIVDVTPIIPKDHE